MSSTAAPVNHRSASEKHFTEYISQQPYCYFAKPLVAYFDVMPQQKRYAPSEKTILSSPDNSVFLACGTYCCKGNENASDQPIDLSKSRSYRSTAESHVSNNNRECTALPLQQTLPFFLQPDQATSFVTFSDGLALENPRTTDNIENENLTLKVLLSNVRSVYNLLPMNRTKSFSTRELLLVRKGRFLSCTVCGKLLSNKHSLRGHMDIHSNTKSYNCKLCGEGFRFHMQKFRHERRCTFTGNQQRVVDDVPK